jgi:hypothetical protein
LLGKLISRGQRDWPWEKVCFGSLADILTSLRAPPEEAAFKTLSTSPAQLQRAKFKALAEEWEPARSRSFVIYPERELIRPRN